MNRKHLWLILPFAAMYLFPYIASRTLPDQLEWWVLPWIVTLQAAFFSVAVPSVMKAFD